MIKTIGIDPGTKSFDICGIKDDGEIEVFLEESIPSSKIAEDPSIILELIKNKGPIDAIVAPSGYGLPLKKIDEITEEDKKLMLLVKESDPGIAVLKGLPKLVDRLKELECDVYLIPGVIHLPTVPSYRKINKIDMGTADKLCCAVLAIYDQAKRLNIKYNEVSLILIELGYAYNACIAVEKGKIVDGIGGTNASISFKSLGCMDGELAYLLGDFKKELLFKGGISDLIMSEDYRKILEYELACEVFFEGIEKMVSSMLVSVKYPREILVSGRLSKDSLIYEEARKRLRKYSNVVKLQGFSKVKEAAQGAALIANGLEGGIAKELIKVMEIEKSSGSILDNLIFKEEVEKVLKLKR